MFPDLYPRDEGKETLKMIVTTLPSDFRVLQAGGHPRRRGPRRMRSLNPLEQLLAQASVGTRDAPTRVTAIDQWITVERSFTLVR